MHPLIESLLLRVHDSSGSVITANSRRLRTLRDHPAAMAQCRLDVMEDIRKYAHVSLETKARCVKCFAQRADVLMRVCGACGIRDPFDTCEKKVEFGQIKSDHWLCAKQDAYDRLMRCQEIPLLAPGPNGGYDTVRVTRMHFHNLFAIGDNAFHVIPEAVIDSKKLDCVGAAREVLSMTLWRSGSIVVPTG
jgi:hypothetical protein